MTDRLIPVVFVLIWSTGFIGAAAVAPYAEPATFLALRFLCVAAILACAIGWLRSNKLSPRDWCVAAVTGALIHGVSLGCVFWAVDRGLPTGVVALIVCLQPLLTAVASSLFLGEALRWRNWAGLVVALGGAAMVVGPQTIEGSAGFAVWNVAACVIALFALTTGTVLQKAYAAAIDFRGALLPQYLGATMVVGAFSLMFETQDITWTVEFVAALAWLVLVLSIGGVSLLFFMIERGAVWRTAALFYLVPPTTALMGWIGFGETLTALQMAGMAIVAVSVFVARTTPLPSRPASFEEARDDHRA
ncbi:MAG: DMT family transporter [Pseudomonadota bacterium]